MLSAKYFLSLCDLLLLDTMLVLMQDNWDPDWHATSSSKVSHLVERLKELRKANRKLGYFSDEEGNFEELLRNRKKNNTTLPDLVSSSKLGRESNSRRPEKVIIFSQFLEHIHVIEQQVKSCKKLFLIFKNRIRQMEDNFNLYFSVNYSWDQICWNVQPNAFM